MRQALGETVALGRARTGMAWMHTSPDVIATYEEILKRTLSVRDYLASFRKPPAFANFALDIPIPAIVKLPVAAWNRFARGQPRP